MDGHTYIKQRQILWALRRGVDLVGSAGDRGERAYTSHLDGNLYQPLSPLARRCYEQGDGNELGDGIRPGKLQAVHSSAAIATNVFDHWLEAGDRDAILKALGLPASHVRNIELERKFPISAKHHRAPNLDVAVHYDHGAAIDVAAVECKFTEAYGNRKHGGLKATYLKDDNLWTGLSALRQLAEQLCPNDHQFHHLHPAQLIKHILGLTACCGAGRFRLVYLWYDVPTPDGDRHRDELLRFAELTAADGVAFSHMTWQECILRLATSSRDVERQYVDYLTERYL